MNWYNIFYWITRADSIKNFFDTSSNIFSWFAVLLFIAMCFVYIAKAVAVSEEQSKNEEEDKTNPEIRSLGIAYKYTSRLFYVALGLSLLTWAGYVFTPTKKEALLIVAGGGAMQFLTTDSSAKKLPSELSNFVVTELKTMAAEAKVDMGISDQKTKILEEAKNMSAAEVIEKMKGDSNFAKLLMSK